MDMLDKIVDDLMPQVLELIMKSDKLSTEQKARLLSQADTALSQLRILRGGLSDWLK